MLGSVKLKSDITVQCCELSLKIYLCFLSRQPSMEWYHKKMGSCKGMTLICWFLWVQNHQLRLSLTRLWQRFHSTELHVLLKVVFRLEINAGKLQRRHITWIKSQLSLMARTRWLLFSCPCKMKLASSQKGIRLWAIMRPSCGCCWFPGC